MVIYTNSCLRVFAPKGKRRRHENMSFCHYFDLRVSRRRHEDTTNKGRQHERFLPADTKFSTKKFSCLHLLKCRYFAQHISCLRFKSRNNDKKAHLRVFAFRLSGRRHENKKWHKSATIVYMYFVNFYRRIKKE